MKKYILTLTCILFSALFLLTSCSRSDFEIQTDVRNAVIFNHPGVQIVVRNGVVNLSGMIESDEAKAEVEGIAKDISGVKSVNSSMEIYVPTPSITPDESLTVAVTEALRTASIEGVEVSVADEEVTLKGKVSKADHKKVTEVMKTIKTKKVIDELTN